MWKTFSYIKNHCGGLWEAGHNTKNFLNLSEARIQVNASIASSIPPVLQLKINADWYLVIIILFFTATGHPKSDERFKARESEYPQHNLQRQFQHSKGINRINFRRKNGNRFRQVRPIQYDQKQRGKHTQRRSKRTQRKRDYWKEVPKHRPETAWKQKQQKHNPFQLKVGITQRRKANQRSKGPNCHKFILLIPEQSGDRLVYYHRLLGKNHKSGTVGGFRFSTIA